MIAGFRTLLQQPPRHLEIRDILLCFQAVQELPQRRVVAGHHTVGSSGAAPLGDVGTARGSNISVDCRVVEVPHIVEEEGVREGGSNPSEHVVVDEGKHIGKK